MRARDIQKILKSSLEQGSSPDKELGSIFIWGPPGIGKSRLVEDTARECNVNMVDYRLLLCDTSDLKGIPVIGKDEEGNQACEWLPPSELPRKGRGFLFFDDFPTAPPLVQACAYQLTIRPHQLGNYKLPEGQVIIGAGNRASDLSLTHKMPPALANRFATHIEMEVNLDDWCDWAFAHNIRPEIIAFLTKFKPDMLFKFDPRKNEVSFPTPRSWEFVSRIMNTLDDSVMFDAIKGSVGEGAAIELKTYMEIWQKLPDLDKILEGQNIIPTSIDIIWACVVGLVSKAKTPKHYARLLDYAMKLEREYTVFMVKMLFRKNAKVLVESPNWKEFATTLVNIEELLDE